MWELIAIGFNFIVVKLWEKLFDVKFIYSEKATKLCEISSVDLTGTT